MTIPEIKLIVLDVDGVLTDGKLLIGSNGVEYKSYHVKDGLGIALAKYCGLEIAIITGRDSESVRIRAQELNIDYVYQGVTNKVEVLDQIIASIGIQYKNVFYMGDDVNDLPIIRKVGFSAAPYDSAEIVKNTANFVCSLNGGMGAVREALDYILSQQLDYKELIENYLYKKTDLFQ